jgi:L-lactate dehydrogenase (cytochrome)/(S)-mandelate dehydrogenase
LRCNPAEFDRWLHRQRVLGGISKPDLSTTVGGMGLDLPVLIAPVGMSGLVHPDGDLALARGAHRAGTTAVISTAASYTVGEVAHSVPTPPAFQLYPIGDQDFVLGLLEQARQHGYRALFVTVDAPVRGNREGERRVGLDISPTLYPATMLSAALRPRWALHALRGKRLAAINYLDRELSITGPKAAVVSAERQARFMQGDMTWQDLRWIRENWQGPLFVKGVMDPDDAARAVEEIGATGVVVSNHGGRQLNHVGSTLRALPGIVDRVGQQAEVLLDGGVRRGTDVAVALALGARAVLVGRPALYGLAAAGERGVRGVLEVLRDELERALVLMGCAAVSDLDRTSVHRQDP